MPASLGPQEPIVCLRVRDRVERSQPMLDPCLPRAEHSYLSAAWHRCRRVHLVERGAARPFRLVLAQHAELSRRRQAPPLLVTSDDLKRRFRPPQPFHDRAAAGPHEVPGCQIAQKDPGKL